VLGLLRRMVRWRVGLRWYAVALLLPVVVTLTAVAINVLLLGALAGDGSVVLTRGEPGAKALQARLASEGVTSTA
jgi:uncharacterized membrane protein